jgi:predicted DNA-binding transcriptional regulator AlpA
MSSLLERAQAGELLTPEELGELLKKPVTWIYEKRRPRCSNPIPALPLGRGSLRFQWSAILTWLESCRKMDVESFAKRRNAPVKRRTKGKTRKAPKPTDGQELHDFATKFFENVVTIDGVLQPDPDLDER